MKKRISILALLIIGLVILAGCSTHYYEALEEYRNAQPTAYHEKTLDWTRESADETATTTTISTDLPTVMRDEASSAPEDVFVALAADFFNVPRERLRESMQPLKDPGQYQSQLADQLEWNELMLAVALHNPAVHAARERWSATLNQYSQADFLESLIAEYRTFTRYLNVQTGKPLNKEMVQRFFPYPGTIALKGELIREQVRLAELDWQKTLRDMVVQAGDAFYRFQYLVRAESTTEENVTLLENLLGVIEEQYRSGSASQADMLRVQTELERQRNMLQDLKSKQHAAAADINALLDRPSDAPLGSPEERDLHLVAPQPEQLLDQALSERQEVNMQEARVARTAVAIRMGEDMNRPLFSQGYSTFERGMMPEASEAESKSPYGLNRKFKDRPAYAQAEAYLIELRKRLQAEQRRLSQIQAETKGMVRSYLEELDVAQREVQLISEIVLPQDRSAYDTTLSAYTTGRASFIDLLDAERALISARLELDKSRQILNRQIVELAKVRGYLFLNADHPDQSN